MVRPTRSILPVWFHELPLQQQAVVLLAARDPDNIGQIHPCREVLRAYRASIWNSARFGRQLGWDEVSVGDAFMSLSLLADVHQWGVVVNQFFQRKEDLSHHFLMALFHGAEILGFKHPDPRHRDCWDGFYQRAAAEMFMTGETEAQLDARLCDWEQAGWD